MTANLQSKVIMTVHFLVSCKNCSLQRFYFFFLNILPNFAACCQCPVLPSAGLSNLWHAFPKWHLEFTALPICLFLLPDQRLYIVKNTHTHPTAYRLYMYYRCYQITLQWNIFTQIGSGAKCWLDICHWGADPEVTGRISDIGQNVL
jgi:hypothetical protein